MRTAHISYSAAVSDHSVQTIISAVIDQANKNVEHIKIYMTSPGGSVLSGHYLYHFLRALPIKITLHALGMVASMGPAIFLSGDTRYAAPDSFFMFHSCGLMGFRGNDQRGLIEDLKTTKYLNDHYIDVLLDRTKLTRAEATSLATGGMQTFGTDWLLKKGIIHEVAAPQIPLGATIIQPNF